MSNKRKLKEHPGTQARAVIVRIHHYGIPPGTDTYAVMREPDAVALAAEGESDGFASVEILGYDALPITITNTDATRIRRRQVATIGTATDGEWDTWHPPWPPEPVPGSAAWHAASDQRKAAADANWRRARQRAATGARITESESDESMPPAMQTMFARFKDGCLNGTACPHKHPYRAEITHQFGCNPGVRLCDRCARALLPYRSRECDLCGKPPPPGECLTRSTLVNGHLQMHMSLCDACYPEGADAPVMEVS